MITLYHSGGAQDFEIITQALSTDEWLRIKRNACRLIQARGHLRASEILNTSNFEVYDATNNFGDEFRILYRTLPIEQYVDFENEVNEGNINEDEYRIIARTISELGSYIRFISVDVELGNEQQPVTTPTPRNTSQIVENALADSMELLRSRGPQNAFDRSHTAIHGYLRIVCDDASIAYSEDSSLTNLFSLIRNSHPSFQNLGPGAEDITRIIRSLSAIIDSVNTLRNRTSAVHPNPNLLENAEAMLVINCVRTIFNYIDSKLNN